MTVDTLEPMAIEAALEADRRYMEMQSEQRRIVELELQQARYEASLAERRYAACDPDNRLIAAQLEKSWETALQRVQAYEARLEAVQKSNCNSTTPDFTNLAQDLETAWNAPGVTTSGSMSPRRLESPSSTFLIPRFIQLDPNRLRRLQTIISLPVASANQIHSLGVEGVVRLQSPHLLKVSDHGFWRRIHGLRLLS